MWMSLLFISSSNINSQFTDRASNHVYAQEREVPLQEVSCNDGTSPDVNGLCADGSQPQGQAPQQLVCSDGTSPDVNGLCADGSQPQGQAPQQLVCSDGTSPDVTTGLCADGSQPQPQGQAPENVSGGGAGGVTTEEQLVCNDGTSPDVTTGLCADGSQPQGKAPQQLVCSDGTAPDVNGLCADGSQPQPQGQAPENVSSSTAGVAATGEQLVCSDGTAPDVNGLCADGSQPQPQGQAPENVSSSTAGVAATGEQLVCNDGTAPDVNGLCADGSQPQASAVNETDLPAKGTGFLQGTTKQDTQDVLRNPVPREEPIQPVAQPSVIHTDATCDKNPAEIVNGEKGERVINLQKVLAKLGLDPGPIDGTFGAATEAAVKQFQASEGLQVDGKVGPNTQAALCSALQEIPPPIPPNPTPSTECDPAAQTIKKLSTGPLVTRLQNLLAERGFNPGAVDGIFGDNTDSAVKQFQQANSLSVDGIVGPNTWKALCASSPNPPPIPPIPPSPTPSAEVCGDGIDNDLDGQVDEFCAPIPVPPSPVCDKSDNSNRSTVAITGEGGPTRCDVPPNVVDPPCPVSNITHPVNRYQKGIWEFNFFIKDGEGLVLENIKAGGKNILDKLSVTHFVAEQSIGAPILKPVAIRYCEVNDVISGQEEPKLIFSKRPEGADKITWAFKKASTSLSPDPSILRGSPTIKYEVIIRNGLTEPEPGFFQNMKCEIVGKTLPSQTKCARLIPKVTFEWQPERPIIDQINSFTAFYRLEYGNSDIGGRALSTFGGTVPGFIQPQVREAKFNAVNEGKPGDIDNIHDMHKNQGIFVPGCRPSVFECFHMHWNWKPNDADPLIDPETDGAINPDSAGKPYLVKDQTIKIGIVKFKQNEQPPAVVNNVNPLTLADDDEVISNFQPATCCPAQFIGPLGPMLTKGDHIVLYYVASAPAKQSAARDTFFKHGIYVLDTSKSPGRNFPFQIPTVFP